MNGLFRLFRGATLLLTVALLPHLALAQGFSAPQEDAIRALVRDYLLKNPEVIVEALQAFEAQQKADQASSQSNVVRQRQAELLQDREAPTAGPANADVTIVEFFDYRCPYCKQVAAPLTQLVRNDAKLRIVYKELPILGPDSVVASRAALAAHLQGAYHKFHGALMTRRGTLDEATILAMAKESGLDAVRLKTDMDRPEITAQIERNRALARDLGIRGTPAFIIGDRVIPGAVDLDTLRNLVAQARQR